MRRPRDMPRIGSEVRLPWAGEIPKEPAARKQFPLLAIFLLTDAAGIIASVLDRLDEFGYICIAAVAALIIWWLARDVPRE